MKTIDLSGTAQRTDLFYYSTKSQQFEFHFMGRTPRHVATHKIIVPRDLPPTTRAVIFDAIYKTLEAEIRS